MPNALAGLPFGWGAIIALINLALGSGVLAAWVRNRPKMREMDLGADEQLRSEMWRDIEALKQSKDAQSRRMTIAEAQIAGQTIQIGQQRFVLTLVIDELERVSPGNSVARQARVLLREILPAALAHPEEIGHMAETVMKAD
ncbi:hypothetical protein [Sphingomonas sp. TREG-RG-20F-R18-01]|uniref:hypothetical protein n=1 Tax=Sphingomonas sp. TREG-RG-20F-R18-01 TaxID=2914982 RepID=UPI001F570663|nr:hypothetical protein [Sphingomonas sp. TREG-RG-20F-R18-01]